MTTLRLVLAVAAAKKWHLKQHDVNTAFLHGDLNEDVYMKIPPCLDEQQGMVCKLQKSLYGLRQASRQWNLKLTATLITLGYKKSVSDHSLFTKITASGITIILVYVDDLVLTGDDISEINRIKGILHDKFKIKDIGDLKFFLGMEVARSAKGIHLCQRKYALDILEDFGFLDCKPVSTPMDYHAKLSSENGTLLSDFTNYRQLVGRLMYLANTRPDISYVMGRLSQFIDCPTTAHLEAAFRVLRYLKGCPTLGLFFPSDSDFLVTGFSDSDWAACVDTRRSITGYCFYIGSALISWKSKKQSTASRSSSETEYHALANATCGPNGFLSFSKTLACHLRLRLPFFVTTDLQFTLPPIPSSMSVLRTLKLTATLLVRSYKAA
ncbi:uncharacterized mitochondrial protein AtMg00810-like [Arachis stenosperma]|uniref:uncharacterized mitochondrial protein AtMg00810-like n=1 Tax=Arachis stenosperma TaxID=217475 RepID=UPI0025ABF7FC|nr:uncharacterized mitochondrial protein AtMg00810-like [Arachis stenosperma]